VLASPSSVRNASMTCSTTSYLFLERTPFYVEDAHVDVVRLVGRLCLCASYGLLLRPVIWIGAQVTQPRRMGGIVGSEVIKISLYVCFVQLSTLGSRSLQALSMLGCLSTPTVCRRQRVLFCSNAAQLFSMNMHDFVVFYCAGGIGEW
jgi:hypothetical protein